MRKIIFSFCVLLFSNSLDADIIKLQNGKEVQGKIVSTTQGEIKVLTDVGIPITYYTEDIKRIITDQKITEPQPIHQNPSVRLKALDEPGDVPLILPTRAPEPFTDTSVVRIVKPLPSSVEYPEEISFYLGNKLLATHKIGFDGNVVKEEGQIPDGIVYEGFPSKKIKMECFYAANRLDGLMKVYNEQGSLTEESNWKDGKRDGVRHTYFSKGTLKGEERWVNGKREGDVKYYDREHRLRRESVYKNDKLSGPYKIYYENGKTKFELFNLNGKRDDLNQEFYPDGTLAVEWKYKEGRLISEKRFDQQGNLINQN
jgi:antitoxin component YwqK of YwqJK toxin-antitoxin module